MRSRVDLSRSNLHCNTNDTLVNTITLRSWSKMHKPMKWSHLRKAVLRSSPSRPSLVEEVKALNRCISILSGYFQIFHAKFPILCFINEATGITWHMLFCAAWTTIYRIFRCNSIYFAFLIFWLSYRVNQTLLNIELQAADRLSRRDFFCYGQRISISLRHRVGMR